MFAVMSSCWKLYSSEGDRTFERNLYSSLLHAILSIECGVTCRCCYATEIPLNLKAKKREISKVSKNSNSENDQDFREQNVTVFLCEYLWWCSALQAKASSSVSPGGQSELRACGPAAAQTSATVGRNIKVTMRNILLKYISSVVSLLMDCFNILL